MFQAPPIFILGNPRSGTTLLRLMLGSHPHISVPPECGFAIWLQRDYGDWSSGQSSKSFLEDLSKCKKFCTWELGISEIQQVIDQVRPTSYSELVSTVYAAYKQKLRPKAHRWGDKNNFHVSHVDDLVCLFPDAYFIHIVRDVRDVVCSYRDMEKYRDTSPYAPRLSTDSNEIAQEWIQNTHSVTTSFSLMNASKRLTICYERLVADPQHELQMICNLLDEPFSLDMLQFHSQNLEPAELLPWKQRTLKPVGEERVQRYKRDLSELEQEKLLSLCHAQLEGFGYLNDL